MSTAPSMPAQTPTYDLISPDFDILQAIRELYSTNYRSERTLRTFMDTKTDTSCGTNLTSGRKSMSLLIDKKLTPASTRNPYDGLDCSRHEQQVTKGIPEYIRDAAHMSALKEYLIRRFSPRRQLDVTNHGMKPLMNRLTGATMQKTIERGGRRIQISKYINDLLPTKQ
jgi:hypothetical protein